MVVDVCVCQKQRTSRTAKGSGENNLIRQLTGRDSLENGCH